MNTPFRCTELPGIAASGTESDRTWSILTDAGQAWEFSLAAGLKPVAKTTHIAENGRHSLPKALLDALASLPLYEDYADAPIHVRKNAALCGKAGLLDLTQKADIEIAPWADLHDLSTEEATAAITHWEQDEDSENVLSLLRAVMPKAVLTDAQKKKLNLDYDFGSPSRLLQSVIDSAPHQWEFAEMPDTEKVCLLQEKDGSQLICAYTDDGFFLMVADPNGPAAADFLYVVDNFPHTFSLADIFPKGGHNKLSDDTMTNADNHMAPLRDMGYQERKFHVTWRGKDRSPSPNTWLYRSFSSPRRYLDFATGFLDCQDNIQKMLTKDREWPVNTVNGWQSLERQPSAAYNYGKRFGAIVMNHLLDAGPRVILGAVDKSPKRAKSLQGHPHLPKVIEKSHEALAHCAWLHSADSLLDFLGPAKEAESEDNRQICPSAFKVCDRQGLAFVRDASFWEAIAEKRPDLLDYAPANAEFSRTCAKTILERGAQGELIISECSAFFSSLHRVVETDDALRTYVVKAFPANTRFAEHLDFSDAELLDMTTRDFNAACQHLQRQLIKSQQRDEILLRALQNDTNMLPCIIRKFPELAESKLFDDTLKEYAEKCASENEEEIDNMFVAFVESVPSKHWSVERLALAAKNGNMYHIMDKALDLISKSESGYGDFRYPYARWFREMKPDLKQPIAAWLHELMVQNPEVAMHAWVTTGARSWDDPIKETFAFFQDACGFSSKHLISAMLSNIEAVAQGLVNCQRNFYGGMLHHLSSVLTTTLPANIVERACRHAPMLAEFIQDTETERNQRCRMAAVSSDPDVIMLLHEPTHAEVQQVKQMDAGLFDVLHQGQPGHPSFQADIESGGAAESMRI